MRYAALALAVALSVSGCAPGPWPRATSGAGGGRTGSIVILAVNDVYRIEGIDAGKRGGLARLRTLRADLERAHPGRVLLLHGGDVLFPSFLSRMYKGKQMIDVLNLMDGDPESGRLDERMFAVFGNHEFDADQECGEQSVLQQRVAESDFSWLHSNIALPPCRQGHPRLVGANLLHAKIVEVGGLRVGLLGLTIGTPHPSFSFMDAQETARTLAADLRRRGADVVVALTHLNWADDLLLFGALRQSGGPDVVIGGHDHVSMSLPEGDPEPRIFKADADAVTAWVVTLTRHADGRVVVGGELRRLDESVAKDPSVDAAVGRWLREHAAAFCAAAAADPGWAGGRPDPVTCLDERLAVAGTVLTASEERIRTGETSLGDWVADQMAGTFRDCGADGAFINAGGLRLNHDLAKGADITRRHLEELIQFPTTLRVYRLTHGGLRRALENGVSQPGAGRWLQVSGEIAFTYRPAEPGGKPKLLKAVVQPPGRPPIEITETSTGELLIVANEYLQKDRTDGFDTILPAPEATPCDASGRDLKALLYAKLKALGRIDPEEERRVCTEADSRRQPCLADERLRGR